MVVSNNITFSLSSDRWAVSERMVYSTLRPRRTISNFIVDKFLLAGIFPT